MPNTNKVTQQAYTPTTVFTTQELCENLKISKPTLYAEIASGRLKTYTVGKRRYATGRAVNNWIAAKESEPFQKGQHPTSPGRHKKSDNLNHEDSRVEPA